MALVQGDYIEYSVEMPWNPSAIGTLYCIPGWQGHKFSKVTWKTGAQRVTAKKSSTWLARGAPPDTINLTRPPKACLKVLKSSLSRSGADCKHVKAQAKLGCGGLGRIRMRSWEAEGKSDPVKIMMLAA